MKRAAIGVRVHSGWGALVAVSGKPGAMEAVERRRVVITDPGIAGANQPYHFAKKLGLREAEKHLANCAAVSERLAVAAIHQIVAELHEREYRVVGAVILLASGRPLPSLPEILASHALIHTAEGEFFRRSFREACNRLEISVTGFRERELDERAQAVFGKAATRLRNEIASLGKSLGPPWTTDQKAAALAAEMVLAGRQNTSIRATGL
jgi:hypothetical protein